MTISISIAAFESDVAIVHQIVHSAADTVATENGPLRTFFKLETDLIANAAATTKSLTTSAAVVEKTLMDSIIVSRGGLTAALTVLEGSLAAAAATAQQTLSSSIHALESALNASHAALEHSLTASVAAAETALTATVSTLRQTVVASASAAQQTLNTSAEATKTTLIASVTKLEQDARDAVQAMLPNIALKEDKASLSTHRSNKDANGIYTTITYRRQDGTLARRSILSGGVSPTYTIRTAVFYKADAVTVELTQVFTLTYVGGELVSEVLQ